MQPTAATPGPIGLHRPEPATAASTPPVPGRRVLHLTTEFPPVIYGGLGTAVGGWVKASARAGIEVAVQLVEGPLVLVGNEGAYGSPRRPLRGEHTEAVAGDEGILCY